MMKDITKYIETSKATWKPRFPGVSYIALHTDPEDKMGTFFIRMDPNSAFPKHRNPEGGQIFVLGGSLDIGGVVVKTGDYFRSESGTTQMVKSPKGCLFLLILEKPMMIVPDKDLEDHNTDALLNSIEMGFNSPSHSAQASEIDYNNREISSEGEVTEALDLDINPSNT